MDTTVGYVYASIIDLAVKIELVLTKEQREEVIALLLKEAAKSPEDPTTLFLQGSINYIRSVSDV